MTLMKYPHMLIYVKSDTQYSHAPHNDIWSTKDCTYYGSPIRL